jgi:hypothetical protein
MKTYFILLLTLICNLSFSSIPYEKCHQRPRFQRFYDGYLYTADKMFIETGFTNSNLISQRDIKLLKNADIIAIDLVFSNYPNGGIYEPLNKARLKSLESAMPFIAKNDYIKWRFIAVGKNLTLSAAKSLFHGFVITYRKKPSMKSILLESKSLSMLNLADFTKKSPEYINNTFTKIFNRKKWENSIFASDITGSMSPYLQQLVIWLSLTDINQEKSKYLFFNDGNLTPDKDKIIGNTGGFYSCVGGRDFEKIIKTMQKGMMNGFGGDCPENNVEALLYLQKKYPNSKEIIMVADNWAPIKDISLVDKIKIPIRIILCGVNKNAIHPDYINLAYKSGGSIHTIEKDIEHLQSITIGKTFRYNGRQYVLTKKGFVYKN